MLSSQGLRTLSKNSWMVLSVFVTNKRSYRSLSRSNRERSLVSMFNNEELSSLRTRISKSLSVLSLYSESLPIDFPSTNCPRSPSKTGFPPTFPLRLSYTRCSTTDDTLPTMSLPEATALMNSRIALTSTGEKVICIDWFSLSRMRHARSRTLATSRS